MSALAFQEPFNQPFQEAIDFLKQKTNLPTNGWRDILGRSHDRSFVVAGAIKDALLSDLRGAIGQALQGEMTLEQFRKAFDQIVARHGWTGWTGEGSEAGRAWRTRVIYETNLKTAHAAGRYRQMTDPDVVLVYRFWRYRHAYYRTPERARPEHQLVFDGKVLAWDDPWWETHYPPNGWNCSCGVETLTQDDLDDEGITPDASPKITYRKVRDPKTGELVDVPVGIDLGWDHAPGRDWSLGIVPRELQKPLGRADNPLKRSQILKPLSDVAKPFAASPLPVGTDPRTAAQRFLAEFGATWDNPALFRDAAGHAIGIGRGLFEKGTGEIKAGKQDRHLMFPILAETLKDPDEIWLDWVRRRDSGSIMLVRRYLRAAANGLGFSSFSWSQAGWEGSTVFSPTRGSANRPDPDYLEKHRSGALLYRRPETK